MEGNGKQRPNPLEKHENLVDSGCAATLMNQNLVKTLINTTEKRTKWTTKAFNTHWKCQITFTLPALHKHRQITWNCFVDNKV
jgi:hypothetical protein